MIDRLPRINVLKERDIQYPFEIRKKPRKNSPDWMKFELENLVHINPSLQIPIPHYAEEDISKEDIYYLVLGSFRYKILDISNE